MFGMNNILLKSKSVSVLLVLFLLFVANPVLCLAESISQEDIPEVVLEAFSQGFFRPSLKIQKPEQDDTLDTLDQETVNSYFERLVFALDWSGYLTLSGYTSSNLVVPDENNTPVTELGVKFNRAEDKLHVLISLAETGEAAFYSGGMDFTPENAIVSADAAAEEILRRLTGMTAPFRSRVVCVEKIAENIKELVLVAYDGDRRWQLTRDNSIALSPSWSPDGGKIVFSSFRRSEDSDLYIADLQERKITTLLHREGTDAAPCWSPTEDWIIFAGSSGFRTDLYLIQPNGSNLRNITSSPSIDTSPSWSPTGREIVFMSDRGGSPQIYRMDRDGANLTRLTYDGNYNSDPDWSPAGDRIVYVRREDKGFQIRIMDPVGDVDVPLTNEYGDHLEPCWSPDGMKIAYSFRGKIWVMNADGSDKRPLLAKGFMPGWSRLPN